MIENCFLSCELLELVIWLRVEPSQLFLVRYNAIGLQKLWSGTLLLFSKQTSYGLCRFSYYIALFYL